MKEIVNNCARRIYFDEDVNVGNSSLTGVDREGHGKTGEDSSRFHTFTVHPHLAGVVTDSTCFHLNTATGNLII